MVLTLHRAFQNFWTQRARYPQFKARKATQQSFSYPQGVKVAGKRLYLPKIGWVRFRKSREVQERISPESPPRSTPTFRIS